MKQTPAESDEELTFRCSCPDWGDPCKHVAAVHLLVTEQLDEDPTLIFLLRGLDRDALRERLLDRAAPAASSKRREEKASMLAIEKHQEEERALPLDPQASWGRGMEPFEMEGRVLCTSSDGEIFEELGDLPLWQAEGSLRELLARVYRAAGQRGLELLGKESASSPGEED